MFCPAPGWILSNGLGDSITDGRRRLQYPLKFFKLEFPESDVLPGKTEVKQGKFVKFIYPVKGYFR